MFSIIFPCVFHDFYIFPHDFYICVSTIFPAFLGISQPFPSISRGFLATKSGSPDAPGGLVEGTDPGLGADQPHRVHRSGDDRGAVSHGVPGVRWERALCKRAGGRGGSGGNM